MSQSSAALCSRDVPVLLSLEASHHHLASCCSRRHWCGPAWDAGVPPALAALLAPGPPCPLLCFRTSPGARAGPRPPSAAPPGGSKRKGSGIASSLGLKKLLSTLGQTPRPKLGRARSYSVEQLQPAAPGPAPHTGASKVRRAPSLQSLSLVRPRGPGKGWAVVGQHCWNEGCVEKMVGILPGGSRGGGCWRPCS